MSTQRFILILLCTSLHSCNRELPLAPPAIDDSAPQLDESFLGNCKQLQASEGFRQNVFICFDGDTHGAIFMDLDRKLYLLVVSELPARSIDDLDNRYRESLVSVEAVRKRMDPDSHILSGPHERQHGSVFHIPHNSRETFVANFFNELLHLNLTTRDIWYKWD